MNRSIQLGSVVAMGLALFLSAGCSRTRDNTAADRSGAPATDRSGAATERAPSQADRNTGMLSAQDRDFAMKAAQGGMTEVEMGNLAQQRGASEQMKEYGRKLVQDHTRMNNDLKDIAGKENITLPTDISADQRRTIDRLSKLSGTQFDREFAKESVKDHRADIDEFRKEATSGDDQSLKNFASSNIPTLQDHLNMAESLEKGGRTTSENR
jgi:putative membrane protein